MGFANTALAANGLASCEWRAPAHDPFRGDVPAAVDDYPDIPAATRKRLQARMEKFAYDDIVAIRRDAIEGHHRYEPALLDMHFGNRRICANVTRESWQPDHEERGLVYCEDGHCVVVPLVCRNVSRLVRRPDAGLMGGPGAAPVHPLSFDAPAAGMPSVPGIAPEPPTTHTLEAPPPLQRVPPATDAPLTPAPLPSLPPTTETPPPPAPVPATPAPPPPEIPPVTTPPPAGPVPPDQPAPPALPPLPGMPPLPPAPAIPEPSFWLLWMGGLGVLWGARRRWRPGP